MRRHVFAALAAVGIVAALSGCASLPAAVAGPLPRLAVLTPLDGIPIRSRDALPPAVPEGDLEAARAAALIALRDDLAGILRTRGLEVLEAELPALTGRRPDARSLAAIGRSSGVEIVVFTQLIAYGDIRRSWLWILAAQGLAAGIGHGVAVAAATGDASLGWWAGSGEFLLESATWVGGPLLGSRGIDPVLMRIWLVRSRDGVVLRKWTREGTRPVRQWFRRKGQPPRAERLRAVADRVFEKLASRLAGVLGTAAPSKPPSTPRPEAQR